MSYVADHSNGGAIIGGSLRRAGFTGVVRYACAGRGDVNITASEVRDLKANGVAIGIVCEHEADWLLRPGSVAARVAASRDIARACGLPDGVIYLAADFDATHWGPTSPGSPGSQNMHVIAGSLNIAASVIGRENVGFYGSKFAIDWLIANAPWVRWFWQTEAWSIGQRRIDRAQLFQRAQAANVAGVQVDINEIWRSNWGQRTQAPPSPPKPVQHGPSGSFTFDGALKLPEGHWGVRGKASNDVVFGTGKADRWAVAKHRICVEGPHRGTHEMTPMPWNS